MASLLGEGTRGDMRCIRGPMGPGGDVLMYASEGGGVELSDWVPWGTGM